MFASGRPGASVLGDGDAEVIEVIGAIAFRGAPDSDVDVEGAVGGGEEVEVVAFLQPFEAGVVHGSKVEGRK